MKKKLSLNFHSTFGPFALCFTSFVGPLLFFTLYYFRTIPTHHSTKGLEGHSLVGQAQRRSL
jgi:hypothetical protein